LPRRARQNRAVPRLLALVALVALAAPATACRRHGGGGSGAPCTAAAGQFAQVARAELAAKHDLAPELRDGVAGLIAPMRDGMVRACREGAWTAESRDCFARADAEAAMKDCWNRLSDDQRAALARLEAGQGSDAGSDAGPGSGSGAPPASGSGSGSAASPGVPPPQQR
jgi:hypothetical protein